ncbi:MAG: 2OG-Fe(II) oxygenase [Cyanobium sp. CZS 25K]|nr:2OG-Fe(II) oxygenase [Cyanobium sp. CZS25K]
MICEQINQSLLSALSAYIRMHPYFLLAPLMLQTQDPHTGVIKRLMAEDFAFLNDESIQQMIEKLLRFGHINIQRYTANQGGYPYWHCELYPRHADADSLHRTLLWAIYLNDGFQAGETEFLYQQRKIAPRTGSILIAPTAFTHTHRGNRPLREDKYIATSWILFRRGEHIFADHE